MRAYKKLTAADLSTKRTITIPKWIISEKAKKDEMVYLSDFIECLPSNCIFLKGATGIGATSMALSDDKNCIIAMPTRATVENKEAIRDENNNVIGKRKDIFPIMGCVNDSELELDAYLRSRNARDGKPAKIVCTYDQVARIIERAIKLGYGFKGWRLYIDEIHQVIDDMIDTKRSKAVRAMMSYIHRDKGIFEDVCCITATPLKKEYFKMWEDLKHLRIVSLEFPSMPRNIESRFTPHLVPATAELVLDHLEGRAFGNAHIFVNSVNFIRDVLNKIDLNKYKSNIKVVCGGNKQNADKLIRLECRKILEEDHSVGKVGAAALAFARAGNEKLKKFGVISSINDPVQKVNFYTKTAFQGCDIFDTDAQQYIISDNSNIYTLNDIQTAFPQIVGRIRNSVNFKIIFLTNVKGRYEKADEGQNTQYEIDKAKREERRSMLMKVAKKLNSVDGREHFLSELKDSERMAAETYYRYDEDTNNLIYDPIFEIKDLSNQDNANDYSSRANLSARLLEAGYNVSVGDVQISDALKKKTTKRISFKKIFEEYASLKTSPTLFSSEERLALLEGAEPLIVSAFNVLGVDKVRELKYAVRDIRRELQTIDEWGMKSKIYKSLNLKYDTFYTSKELKEKRLHTVKELGLTRPLKIADFYEVKATTQREMIGIVSGYRILGKKKLV